MQQEKIRLCYFNQRMTDETPLFLACQEGRLEIVQALIDAAGENKALLFQPTNNGVDSSLYSMSKGTFRDCTSPH